MTVVMGVAALVIVAPGEQQQQQQQQPQQPQQQHEGEEQDQQHQQHHHERPQPQPQQQPPQQQQVQQQPLQMLLGMRRQGWRHRTAPAATETVSRRSRTSSYAAPRSSRRAASTATTPRSSRAAAAWRTDTAQGERGGAKPATASRWIYEVEEHRDMLRYPHHEVEEYERYRFPLWGGGLMPTRSEDMRARLTARRSALSAAAVAVAEAEIARVAAAEAAKRAEPVIAAGEKRHHIRQRQKLQQKLEDEERVRQEKLAQQLQQPHSGVGRQGQLVRLASVKAADGATAKAAAPASGSFEGGAAGKVILPVALEARVAAMPLKSQGSHKGEVESSGQPNRSERRAV